jgi:hypothetical protein
MRPPEIPPKPEFSGSSHALIEAVTSMWLPGLPSEMAVAAELACPLADRVGRAGRTVRRGGRSRAASSLQSRHSIRLSYIVIALLKEEEQIEAERVVSDTSSALPSANPANAETGPSTTLGYRLFR